ncbi:MAG: hypothetical protein QXK91_05585 [Nitrososphaerales archaeon]
MKSSYTEYATVRSVKSRVRLKPIPKSLSPFIARGCSGVYLTSSSLNVRCLC